MATIHLATCVHPPDPDPDEPLLLQALERAGVRAQMVAWDGPDGEHAGSGADAVVLRSTWNYYEDCAGFLAWCDRVAARTTLLNPPAAVRRNAHKRYLLDLERAGVPIVPTAMFDRGSAVDAVRALRDLGWAEVVLKPAVSAGSFATRRFRLAGGEEAEAAAFLASCLAERDMMAQPYLRSVEGPGERSIMWIDGEVTHAVRKTARFAGEEESVSAALEPTAEERAFALRTLEAAGEPGLLYARVDVMRDDAGRLVLSELELIEPSLFFQDAGWALERFVSGLLARVGEGR